MAVTSLRSRITWDYLGTVFFYGKQKINLTKSTAWNVTWASPLTLSKDRCGSCKAPSSEKRTFISTFTNILRLNFSAVWILDVTAENKLLFANNRRYSTYLVQTDCFSPTPVVLWWYFLWEGMKTKSPSGHDAQFTNVNIFSSPGYIIIILWAGQKNAKKSFLELFKMPPSNFSDSVSFVHLFKHHKVSLQIQTINRSCINTSPANPPSSLSCLLKEASDPNIDRLSTPAIYFN